MRKKRKICISMAWLMALAWMLVLTACGTNRGQKEPVTLTIWHVYGGQTDSPLNDMIDEFNQTIGKEEGIYVQVASVTNTNTIHEDVLAAANQDPGAAKLPDLFVSYPKTVLAMPDENILVDYRDYFSEEELEMYLPEFLEEGNINGKQMILPVAKSTEIMYINKTAFDRFAEETGSGLEELNTWEGVYETAEKYTAWTDAQTPDVPNDGKPFFVHDYHFNYFQVGTESLGEDFFDGNTIAFGEKFEQAWEAYANAALHGAVWLENGYATEALRTGDAIVSVASSASILYYSDVVTYPDNNSEQIEIIARPCPVFRDGEKFVMQRGAGICTVKSTQEKEKAACKFLKWLTEPEKNVEFVTQAGYAIVSVASSASILYYSDVVTYPDNNSEQIEIIARPCPVFRDGEKFVMQRGAGICTVKSTQEKEKAACKFLKWLTEPEKNVEFVTQAGYMPVTQEAFDTYLPEAVENLEDPKYKELYQAFQETQREYEFYTPPQLTTYLELEMDFEENVRLLLRAGRNSLLAQGMKEIDLVGKSCEVLEQLKKRYG